MADGRTALNLIRSHRPDVAIVDEHLPILSGQRILAAMARDELPTRVLLLGLPAGGAGYDAIAAGAAGYVSRTTGAAELRDAVLAVARDEAVLGSEAQTALAAEIRRRAGTAGPMLTTRERQVLTLIAEGQSAAAIARELHLSPSTVKTILVHLYRRLGVSERAAAVAVALRTGLID